LATNSLGRNGYSKSRTKRCISGDGGIIVGS
jgi:hypothetical protein